MKWFVLALMFLVVFGAGVGSGLLYAGYFTTAKAAAVETKASVGQAVADTRTVDASDASLKASRERARKSVAAPVDATCPPGRGAVSDAAAERLRLALERAKASGVRARQP